MTEHEVVQRAASSLYGLLLRWAKATPNRIYYYGPTGPTSYGEMVDLSRRLAHSIARNAGFSRRPLLAACVESHENFLCLIWGCLAAGIGLAFLPRSLEGSPLLALMDRVGAASLVTDIPSLWGQPRFVAFESLMEQSKELRGPEVEPRPVAAADRDFSPAFLFQTSGTTGDAKWVEVRHDKFLKAIESLDRFGGLKHAADQVVLITPPLSHSYGLSTLLEYTAAGGQIALPSGSSRFGPVGELQMRGLASLVTAIEGVPYFYFQMSKLLDRIKLPALKHLGLGGGGMDIQVFDLIMVAYPALSYSIRYGMTETPSVVSQKIFAPPYDGNRRSSGKILPIYELRIIDANGNLAGPNQTGEIHIRGDCLALPYLGEEGHHCSFFATGDIGYLNEEGELFVVGRKSLYLKVRGFRVSPETIESAILAFAGVVDCRVSMRDSVLVAEVAVADADFSSRMLLKYLASRLPSYAVPDEVSFIDRIPRTPSGKIRRY